MKEKVDMKKFLIFSLAGWLLLGLILLVGCSSIETPHCDHGYTDTKEALVSCQKTAEQGDALAQIYLGNKYHHGKGDVTKDYKQALHWYKKAADQGWATAQYDLGQMYFRGEGVTQDYKEAVKWYRKAAEQGYARAQVNLGLMYYNGDAVIQDNVYAHMWWNISASIGDDSALKNIDIIEKKMTNADISKAQELKQECVKNKYKGC